MEIWNQIYGGLNNSLVYSIIGAVVILIALGFTGAPFLLWTVFLAAVLVGFGAPVWLLVVAAVVAVIGNIKPLRAALVSGPLMRFMVKMQFLPAISDTEMQAITAGSTWMEAEVFSGKPDFKKMLAEPYPELTPEEKAFLDGPVEKLCACVDDWDVWEKRDIPPQAWEILKREKFLGMIIPKEYGGLGFSAYAHSEVIQKISSHSVATSITVMVPNSLGPAELLVHYGTDAQKKSLLPKLASGEEVPCFGLTEPVAGSDAGAITSNGVLFKGTDGKIYIRLNWNKRYITLAAIATTIGLAFRLRDPENLLGKGEDLGITAALIPAKTPGVVLGRRHDPLGTPFYNCPTQGHDVVVNAEEAVIGGLVNTGRGWQMVMECLGAGRGISLPAQSAGGAKLVSRVASAHATLRKQFGMSIGRFEGIEEPLARIAGYTYIIESMRKYILGALDKGMKPAVVTAMAKYHSTELARKIVNDGMDVVAGNGISLGPRNSLGHLYISTPIGITVEGANILTRTLMIFGQGALRCHPYAFKEVTTAQKGDVAGFDAAFWGHIGHVVRNTFRSIVLSWTRGRLAPSPVGGEVAQYYRKLAWASASFAILADIGMGSLGGALKGAQKITGRYADIFSWMFIGTSVLRRYEAEGRRKEDLPFVHFAMMHSLNEIQKAFDGIFANLPVPGLTWFFRLVVGPWGSFNALSTEPSDKLTHKMATLIQEDSEQRDRFTFGIYSSKDPEQALGRLNKAFKAVKRAEVIDKKVRAAVRAKTIPRTKGSAIYQLALDKNVITQAEFSEIKAAEELRTDAIQVDSFTQDEYLGHSAASQAHRGASAAQMTASAPLK